MTDNSKIALGLDYGTESVRALLVDLGGDEQSSAVVGYTHGQVIDSLPGSGERLPADFALQHPTDWVESAVRAVAEALKKGGVSGEDVISIGVDFTSCTMLPTQQDGTPLCLTEPLSGEMLAWPKLWKHHGAKTQTERINKLARSRNEKWLDRYGGIIGLEWFFPKMLETLEKAPHVYEAAEVWLEAGDWLVWQLVGGAAENLPRSTCQAGYKAMWHHAEGYPSSEFFAALNPKMENVVEEKLPGRFLSPGQSAGGLTESMAKNMGLRPGIPVSAAIIDAHAGVPGAGAADPGTLVMVMGTSNCHMLNDPKERSVPGVAGVVEGGILPEYFGYETGQAAVGDAFDWLRRTTGHEDFDELTRMAESLPPGAEGVLAMDWFNGCRTPLMDGSLTGAFVGLTLHHSAHHMYRAVMEASAFGLRWIVDILRESGVEVNRFVATGGLPHHNPLLVQITADVLGEEIYVHPSQQGPALGAAILGVLAAGSDVSGFESAAQAISVMAGEKPGDPNRTLKVTPHNPEAHKVYCEVYKRYRSLADMLTSSSN